jgi:hypothetical protein
MRLRVTFLTTAIVAGLCATVAVAAPVSASATPSGTGYSAGTAQLATITDGAQAAPWNEWQGDPAAPAYSSVSPGTLLPSYTPGGASTGSGVAAEPNVAVMPAANSGTDGVAPYPSGTVGTPGPLDGYCGTGNQTTASAGSPARQPAGTTLPLGPAYFPHIVRNSDGSLTGYFDYRPKDADEAVEVANSTDGGRDWTYQGEALEQNPGYCPSDDINDDGNGHPYVLTVGGVTRLYTLQRAAGDNQGIGMLAHTLSPTATDPLNGAPATEQVGIDPDAFVPSGGGVSLTNTSATTVTVSSTGSAGSTLQLVPGGFVDLTQTPVPTASSVITCTGVGATVLTGCTSATAAGETINAGDLIEQVIGFVNGSFTVPAGPNTTTGDGGLGTINVVTASGGSTKGFTNPVTGTTYNVNAPNRAYVNGVAVYCDQANANPTTKMEACTTGPGRSALSIATGAPITADPIIPATAAMTSGLLAPDGIVGVLPSYPGAPAGSTIVMYTEKELAYYVSGTTTNSSSSVFGSNIAFVPSPYVSQDLPIPSAASPVTVQMGDATKSAIVPVTCTGLTSGATDTLTGCTVPAADSGDSYSSTSLIGAPGATTVPAATLAQIGEGSTSTAKLFKNNEDLAVVRVAYTTDGINFATGGLANGGVISGASGGASNYTDLTNTTLTGSPSDLNAYATPGTADATELRWAGSAGSIVTNPDGSYGLFLSGAWAADGDSDAYNQIFYSTSTDGQHWSIPTTVVSTDYTFSASVAQDKALAAGTDAPLGISAYYSGRAYGPSVVQNPDGTLTMLFAGYRLPKVIAAAGTSLGTDAASPYTVGATDPVACRNILTETLTSSTSPQVATQVAVAAAPSSPTIGQPVTYTATVSVPSPGTGTPTGTVSFTGAAGTLCAAATLSDTAPDTASCTVSYTSAQTDTVTASYSGDANYAAGSGQLAEQIGKLTSSTSLVTSAPSAPAGDPVTYTATVAAPAAGSPSPTGTVEFSDAGTDLTGCSAVTVGSDLTAACTVTYPATGAHSVAATYSGDGNFTGSASGPAPVTVTARTATITVSAGAGPFVSGQPVAITATVGDGTPLVPTGTVEFSSAGSDLPGCAAVALSNGSATCTVAGGFGAGPVSVVAGYSGDAAFAPVDDSASPYTFTVVPALALTWNPPAPITYGTALNSTELDATANAGGSFAYSVQSGPGGTTGESIANGSVLPAGSYLLKATFTPTSSAYSPSSVTVALTVNKAALAITVKPVSILASLLSGKVTFSAAASGGPAPAAGISVTFMVTTLAKQKISCTAVTDAGGVATCTSDSVVALLLAYPPVYQVTAPASANYLAATTTGKINLI